MNSKEIPFEEQKVIALDVLKTIAIYCDSNNLKYYLAYGTLLGAVRHNGFIPWDDDIDIVMNREDYTFFINHFKTDIYDCVSFENDTFYFPYAKVIDNRTVVFSDNINDHDMGISVDVFPFDYISDSERESIRNQKKSTLCWKGLRYSLYNNVEEVRESKIDFDKVVFYILSKCLGMKYWKRRIRSYIKKYTSRNKTEYCGVYVPITPTVIRMYDSVILEHRSKYKFEDEMFYSFENADYFLSTTYGKYMILPPEEQRIPHFRKAYWKEP